MNANELTEYIKNYLENDKTRSAVMLTGDWGCGKSYYIQNTLVPALTEADENKCIVVSLYGIKSLEALSKSIYIEVRAKALAKKSESLNVAKIFGKTIIKGVASFFGVNINVSEDDLNKLYQSIDLTGKLIVLEDLERSGIDIIEIMGYVNNLVEQDGVKVLLVANEKEIIKYEDKEEIDGDSKKKITSIPTQKTREYLRIKEKTIRDTILFYADLYYSIESILKSFQNCHLNEMLNEKTTAGIPLIVDEIAKVMSEVKCYNLRALLYSCQKVTEMISKSGCKCSDKYFKFTLCSITAFALRLSMDCNLSWTDDIKSPAKLGSYHFPLRKCCYNYIKMQYFDGSQFRNDEVAYLQQEAFEIRQKDLQQAMNVLYNFYEQTENDVTQAVDKVNQYLLKGDEYIPFKQYGKLVNYLVAVRGLINDDSLIESCKKAMLENLKEATISKDTTYNFIQFALWSEEQQEEYNEFVQQMNDTVKEEHIELVGHISSIDDIQKLIENVYKNRDKYINSRAFIQKFDIDGLLTVIPKCSAKQISELSEAIISVYNFCSNIADFLSGDKPLLNKLANEIQSIIDSNEIRDKIIRLQLSWFKNNLEDIIKRLN